MSKESTIRVSLELEDIAKSIEQNLLDIAGEKFGFALFVFPLNELGRSSYISNANRQDFIENIRLWLDSQSSGLADVPAHKIN